MIAAPIFQTTKMRSNATTTNGRIVTTAFVRRTMVFVFVFFQVLIQHRYCNPAQRNVILNIHAFSQQLTSITSQRPSFARRDSDSREYWRKQTSSFVFFDRRSLAPLHDANTGTASITSTENHATNNTSSSSSGSSNRGNTQVRSIMSILEQRYDVSLQPNAAIEQKRKTREWKKTRNYLYHATRSHQDQDRSGGENVDAGTTFEEQVVTVLDFLDVRLELSPDVSRKILQDSPRILRKPVDSFLIPTADFLLQLWGRDLFVQAVERNPALLLSSGVGYTTNRKSKGGSSRNDAAAPRKKKDANGTVVDTITSVGIDQSVEEILFLHTGLSSGAMKRMKGTAPFVFGLEPSKVHSVLEFLDGILRERANDATATATTTEEDDLKQKKILGKVILAYPYLLNLSVESNLKPRVKFLAESCNLNPTEVAKMVQTSNGSVLSLSVEQNLKPTMDFLLEEIFHEHGNGNDDKNINLGDDDDPRTMLKKCMLTHPQLLGLSLSNLKSKVDYFRSIGPSLAVRIARKCPAIYSLNLDQNIIPTIEFLARVWGTNTTSEIIVSKTKSNSNSNGLVPMLHEYPNIITLSVETNLKPTMKFFNKTGYTLLNKNWELIPSTLPPSNIGSSDDDDSQPGTKNSNNNNKNNTSRIRGRYIAASLYNRLLPRWHYWLSNAAEDTNGDGSSNTESASASAFSAVSTPPPPETPPLHLLVMASDVAFCRARGVEPESFLSFKKDAIPRLKFSSQFDTWLKTGKPIDM